MTSLRASPSGRPVVLPDRAAGRASFDPFNKADQRAAARVGLAVNVALWAALLVCIAEWLA